MFKILSGPFNALKEAMFVLPIILPVMFALSVRPGAVETQFDYGSRVGLRIEEHIRVIPPVTESNFKKLVLGNSQFLPILGMQLFVYILTKTTLKQKKVLTKGPLLLAIPCFPPSSFIADRASFCFQPYPWRENSRLHGLPQTPSCISPILLLIRPEEPTATILFEKIKLSTNIILLLLRATPERAWIECPRPLTNNDSTSHTAEFLCRSCEHYRRLGVRIGKGKSMAFCRGPNVRFGETSVEVMIQDCESGGAFVYNIVCIEFGSPAIPEIDWDFRMGSKLMHSKGVPGL